MVTFGAVLLYPEPTFVGPAWRVIAALVTEQQAGVISITFGVVRLTALWVNGRRGRETSLLRTVGCVAGFFFWAALSIGFAAAFPPLSTGIAVYGVLAIAELHSSGRAASDMAAEDTFGLRKRRRINLAAEAEERRRSRGGSVGNPR
ncbi:hypothetical protein A5481_25340 [Methylobacterium platani]|uniref:Uncharacterized protein n=2 Tax=Methylobacterium platani TaxID=427683 RepID=A0A179S396_9HYPH|nr:hypothetical protein A5481_25340 [Methylobacterium platani]